jgi:hypothetical protein
MSIDTCKGCSSYVDTDFDTDCYELYDENGTTIKQLDFCLCERCRENEETVARVLNSGGAHGERDNREVTG